MERSNIPWHPAFLAAIQLELEAYKDSLEFYAEYQLTTEPLRIDCVVIKKEKNVVIKKNIAAIFREVNLLEYKSPDDYLSIADFYKVYGYACQYVYLKSEPITNMSLSFVVMHYPKKLINHLKIIREFTVAESYPGIYTIGGDILPIQVINSRKLSVEENLWLKGLSNRLDPLAVLRIGDKAVKQKKTALINAYMNAITQANALAMEEAMNMRKAAVSFDEVIERTGLAAKWEARGEAMAEPKWRQCEAIDIAQNMINLGFPLDAIASATRLDPEKVKTLYQGAYDK